DATDAGPSPATGFMVATDGSNDVLLAGTLSQGSIDFGMQQIYDQVAMGESQVVFAKFDSTGTPVWSNQLKSLTGGSYVNALAGDTAGNAYLVGGFSGELDQSVSCHVTAQATESILIAKLDSTGVPTWCDAFGTTGLMSANSITIDTAGNIIITGVLAGSA